MMKKRKYLPIAAIAAVALVAAACSSSDDDMMAPADRMAPAELTYGDAKAGTDLEAGTYTPDAALVAAIEDAPAADREGAAGEHPMGTMIMLAGFAFECVEGPCSVTVNDDDTVTTTGIIRVMAQMDSTGPTTAGLFATAQGARTDAEAAGTAAAAAVKAATDAQAKLGTLNAAGDSMAEYTNAKAILDADADAKQAVVDAEAAKTAAETAKTAAEALDADNAHKASLLAALNEAIKVADAQIKAATLSRDRDDLEAAVDAVTGGENADPQGTPASLAKAVAMAVGEALGAMTTDAGLPRPVADDAIVDEVADPTTVMNVVGMNDSQGKTWAGIVGDKAMESRVGASNTVVMIASIDGMTATAVHDDGFTGTFRDGQEITGANYKGILGTAYCLSADCAVTDGKLEKGWYFTPTSPTAFYVKSTADDDPATMDVDESKRYVAETLYAQFGHWLTMVDEGGAMVVQVNRYATTEGNTDNLSYVKATGMPDSATYNGDAAGMSLHKTLDSDGGITSIYSGAFTADAELILRFGDGADLTLGGTIDNFQTESEGMNVDPLWTVELERRVFASDPQGGTGMGSFADGKTVATGRDGVWSATAYGEQNMRPTGVFGGFNAHFSDGHAAGVYATR